MNCASETTHTRTSTQDRSEGHAKGRLLVVDDDSSVREMLTRVLVAEGYEVWAASNGTAALTIASTAHVDLVLLDLNMPGRSGWDTFERLTTDNPLLSVVIVTARPNQLFMAMGAGVAALVEKPIHFPKLLETVRGLLQEPEEFRLARAAGKLTRLHYLRSWKARSSGVRSPSS
jgi:DNA-binding response OmpR family regulator